MIPDERLKFITGDYWEGLADSDGAEILEIAQELLRLRKENADLKNKEDGYALFISNANNDVARFQEYADKMRNESAELKETLKMYLDMRTVNLREIMELREQKRLLIEDAERLYMWVMSFTNLCDCPCNNETNKMRIERDRKQHADLMKKLGHS